MLLAVGSLLNGCTMISAKVIADSTANGIRLTTLELKFHRFILPEFNTHRMFSRSASSSRAIPVETTIKQVLENPAMPIHWGKNQPGMQAREECNNLVYIDLDKHDTYYHKQVDAWKLAAHVTSKFADNFASAGYHKQIVNRLLEPFQWIKVIVTATEWENFFELRLHKDAQPEMMVLAERMKEAMEDSTPKELAVGQWHLPYVEFPAQRGYEIALELAIKCSVARCARVSYLNHDNSTPNIEKDLLLADKLLEAGHFSPFEHQATPISEVYKERWEFDIEWVDGITHIDRDNNYWSGNFKSWLQYRQTI